MLLPGQVTFQGASLETYTGVLHSLGLPWRTRGCGESEQGRELMGRRGEVSQTPLLRASDEIGSFFARGPTPAEIATFRLSEETTTRVRALLRKNSAGTLTAEEAAELDQCVQLDRLLLLLRSRVPRPPDGAA